jgi:hypothetical protein
MGWGRIRGRLILGMIFPKTGIHFSGPCLFARNLSEGLPGDNHGKRRGAAN